MYKHHEETIRNISEKLKKNEEVLALLIGGSIAHGFAKESSDVDIMIVVSDENYKARVKSGDMHYWENESCTYKDGYIDGKYTCPELMDKVAKCGSEPARFAYEGAMIAFSRLENLQETLNRITRYPAESKSENIKRFYAQLEAWRWYCSEALKHNNEYLLNCSISNLVLFGGRLILAENETLYPYHKWFLKVLEKVSSKPENIMQAIEAVLKKKTEDSIEEFYRCILNFKDWGLSGLSWPSQFMVDSELSWMDGKVPVADI